MEFFWFWLGGAAVVGFEAARDWREDPAWFDWPALAMIPLWPVFLVWLLFDPPPKGRR